MLKTTEMTKMAKFTLEFDTVEKKMVAMLDGTKLENVYNISFYNYGEENASMEITSHSYDEENKMSVMTRTMASEQNDKAPKKSLSEKLAKRLGV